jgi:putative endonuclease
MKTYYVYILASQARGTLYIGVSNSLQRRSFEHAQGEQDGFTKKYHVKRLVYFEETNSVEVAITREKQLKNWHRQWKINLIESINPEWQDLAVAYRMDVETSST